MMLQAIQAMVDSRLQSLIYIVDKGFSMSSSLSNLSMGEGWITKREVLNWAW